MVGIEVIPMPMTWMPTNGGYQRGYPTYLQMKVTPYALKTELM